MALCTLCGLTCVGPDVWGLCDHHTFFAADAWAAGNRIICDLIHRGVEPVRLPLEEREPIA